MFCDPRAELALAIHAKTDNGNDIVDFLKDVLDQNIPDVRLTHRLQSARMLTKHGHFPDAEQFIRRHANKPGPRKTGRQATETSEFDAALQKVIRVEISPASTAQWLIDVMQGRAPAIETGIDTFKPHHRMRAVREILARAYDRDYSYATETRQPQTQVAQPVASEDADAVAEPTEQATEDANAVSNDAYTPEEQAQIQEVLDRIDRLVEEADPSEYEEEESSDRKIDYSMWDIIDSLPEPEITEEHARIGAALFYEAVEKQRIWRESGVKIPTRKDYDNYDDG